jgi:peptide subunit release factor 1 (eRF1)
MTNINKDVVEFQCPQCGFALEQTIGQIKSPEPMRCAGCGVIISTDTNASSNAADEIRKAAEKVPAEITIKFNDPAENEEDGA